MAEPYESTQDYIQAVLHLTDRRLSALESGEPEKALLLADRVEERIRRRCEATVEAGGGRFLGLSLPCLSSVPL